MDASSPRSYRGCHRVAGHVVREAWASGGSVDRAGGVGSWHVGLEGVPLVISPDSLLGT